MLTAFHSQGHAQCTRNASAEQVQYVEPKEDITKGVKYVDTPEAHTFRLSLSP